MDLNYEVTKYNEYYKRNLDINKVQEVYNTLDKQGHSGFSASYVIKYLKGLVENPVKVNKMLQDILNKHRDYIQQLITSNIMEIYDLISDLDKQEQEAIINLLAFKPITPLLGTDDEWHDITEYSVCDNGLIVKEYQNKRCSAVFKTVFSNGLEIPFYLDSHVYSDNGGIDFFNTNMYGREEISFPFEIPKEPKVVHVFHKEGTTPMILTNPKTIAKLKELNESKED